jgi:hypothetical protein
MVYFIKQLLLVALEMPRKDLKFVDIPEVIYIRNRLPSEFTAKES